MLEEEPQSQSVGWGAGKVLLEFRWRLYLVVLECLSGTPGRQRLGHDVGDGYMINLQADTAVIVYRPEARILNALRSWLQSEKLD